MRWLLVSFAVLLTIHCPEQGTGFGSRFPKSLFVSLSHVWSRAASLRKGARFPDYLTSTGDTHIIGEAVRLHTAFIPLLPSMWFLSYWAVPIFSSLVWLAMLIAMLTTWTTQGSPHYSTMDPAQHIAYISDIGAQGLKPLFIAMSTVTAVTFDLAFIFERWLRHTGKLTPNTSTWQKFYSFCAIVASIAGAAGLILLTIYDSLHHDRLHNVFLALFIIGYIVSAIFICWEYQRLGIHFREQSVLRYSFWIKLAFILIEVALAIAFGVTKRQKLWNAAAVLEWVIAFIYFFYVLSFFIDFMPAVRGKHHQSRETEMNMAENGMGDGAADGEQYYRGNQQRAATGYTNGNEYTNGMNGNGYMNGTNGATHNFKPAEPAPLPSRNF